LVTFAATGVVLANVPWRMTETLQVALAVVGLALTFGAIRGRLASRRLEICGAALLGLLVSLREPNAIVAAAPVVAALVERQTGRAARLAVTTAAAYLAVIGITVALTGAPNPYKATRATFNAETGYPAGRDSAAALARLDSGDQLATSTLGVVPASDAGRSAYAALYFLAGRHTGLLWYLPATAVFFLVALRGSDRPGRVALASFAALALFYLVWMPVNYFGGETFVGNRYILAGAALPLVALVRPPGRRALALAWAIAAVVAGSALLSVLRTRDLDATSQSHANAGLFRLLPYESTASNIDGRRDRYWSGDFVRFVDPFARAERWSYVLTAGTPPAELEIATRRGVDRLHFLAHADAADAWLEISDWGRRERFHLTPLADGRAGGSVEFRPSPSWRRHRYWWSAEVPYATRLVRFSARSAAERPVEVRLRYLGRSGAPADGYGRELVKLVLDGPAVAGGTSSLALEVRNTGSWSWTSEAALPVQLGLRFRKIAGDDSVIEARRPLPGVVKPGELLATTVAIDWPREPGRYRVTLDLVLEDSAWFAEKVGEPLASTEIDVLPAPKS
jgi:hypothetical protein